MRARHASPGEEVKRRESSLRLAQRWWAVRARVEGVSGRLPGVTGAVECRQAKLMGREDTMNQATEQQGRQEGEVPGATTSPASGKEVWQEPKLAFIEPTLTIHGQLEEVTAGFFGGFTP
jgi:hypothetical protein